MIKKIFACCLLLSLSALAQPSLDRVKSVRQSVNGDKVTIVVETQNRVPQGSAYFAASPDRLLIELNDCEAGATLPAKPHTGMVSSWSLKPTALNRCTLSVSLAYRPPTTALKVTTLTAPPRLVVEFSAPEVVSEKWQLTEGISWFREDKIVKGQWTRFNRLHFDPADPNIEVMVGLAKEQTNTRETLTSMVSRYGAVGGVNGGFFAGSGGVLGLVFREGKMIAPHVSRRPPRSAFGITRAGRVLFGRLAAVGTQIKDLDGGDWSEAWTALGGGPRLIKNGQPKITSDLEELGPKGNDITRVAARTVVASTQSNQLFFATVTGYRDNHKQGLQFGPLVGWLQSLSVQDAVNYDGGASVNMVVGEHIVSDGPGNRSKEKPVATALLVKDKRAKLFPDKARWHFEKTVLPADGKSEATLEVALATPGGEPVADGTPVRFFAEGVVVEPAEATVKEGKVRATVRSVLNPGKASINLASGPLLAKETLTLQAGKTERIMVQLTRAVMLEGDNPLQRATVKIQTLDQWGNPVAGEAFSCRLDGGETLKFTTNNNAIMVLDLDLEPAGGQFVVSHPSGDKVLKIEAMEVKKKQAAPVENSK